MANWYYLVKGQQEGPVSQEELLQKFTGGQLAPDTFIWSKGMEDWLRASEVDGFSEEPTPPPIEATPPPVEEDSSPAAPATEESAAATTLAAALADEEPAQAASPTAEPEAAAAPAAKKKLSLSKKEEPAAPTDAAPEPEASDESATVTASVMNQPDFSPQTETEAAYLYISVFRLIFMSIFSFGIYEIYWVYKNWKYAKQRDGLDIMPFWRGWFAIFHCHNLLRYIHTDRVLTRWEEPKFKPGLLATIWVIMQIIAHINGRVGSQEFSTGTLLGPLWPSFLCFVPVQIYINRVNRQMAPEAKKTSLFTFGHIVIGMIGLLVWGIVGASLIFGEKLVQYLQTLPQ